MTGSGIGLPGNGDMNIMAIFISHYFEDCRRIPKILQGIRKCSIRCSLSILQWKTFLLLSILLIFKYHTSLYLLPNSLLLFWIKLLQKLYALPVAIFSLLMSSWTHSSLLLFLPLHWNSSFLTWHLAEFINFFSLKHLPPFPLRIQSPLVFLLTQ